MQMPAGLPLTLFGQSLILKVAGGNHVFGYKSLVIQVLSIVLGKFDCKCICTKSP